MAARVIGQGTEVSYEDLLQQVGEGESLFATWLRDPLNVPREEEITGQGQFAIIVAKTIHGYYVQLKFEARAPD